MNAYLIAAVLAGGGVLGVVVWVLAKLGRALIKLAEALAAAAVVLSAQARRVPRGGSVHLSVTGLFPDGVSVLVYGAMPVPEHGLGADLTPDACMIIPLGALRCATTLREVKAR
jgi:hypothetical protein